MPVCFTFKNKFMILILVYSMCYNYLNDTGNRRIDFLTTVS